MIRFVPLLILVFLSGWIVSCGETRFSSDIDPNHVKASDVVDEDTPRTGEEQEIIDRVVEENICDDKGKKVRICHIPPGNPANRHTICIGYPALKAHVGCHGVDDDRDYVGHCDTDGDDDDDDDDNGDDDGGEIS